MKTAILESNDQWLANQLKDKMNAKEISHRNRTVPSNAAQTLAEGEFNRFYARGLCLYALANNIDELTVYRAKDVQNHRPDSKRKEDTQISAAKLLEDLRKNIGKDTILELASPNSGLSVKLP